MYIMYKILLVILACFLFKYLITPTDVILCWGPGGEDALDVYAQNNPISKAQMVPDPKTYWQDHPYESDPYAQHQRALGQNSGPPQPRISKPFSPVSPLLPNDLPTPRNYQSAFPDYQVFRSNSNFGSPAPIGRDFYSIFYSNDQSSYIPQSNGCISKTSDVYELHSKPIPELAGEPVAQKYSTKNVRFELAGDCTFSNFVDSSKLKSKFGTVKTVSTMMGEIEDGNLGDSTISLTNEWSLPHYKVKGTGLTFFKGIELGKQCFYLICKLGKRKLMWKLWEKDRGFYKDYNDFKYDWNFNEKFWEKIERDVKKDIKCNLRDFVGYNDMKKELRKSVKREVEKVLREKQPFKK